MQGTLYDSGGILSQSILMIIYLMGVYYFFKTNRLNNLPVFIKGSNLFFGLLSIYGLILLFSDNHYYLGNGVRVENFNYLKNLLMSFPNIYVFYYVSAKQELTYSIMKKWLLFFFAFGIFLFFRYQQEQLNNYMQNGIDAEGVTNNIGYVFLVLMPSIVFFKDRPRLQYLLLTVLILFLLIGMKRGAILIGFVLALILLYINYSDHGGKSKIRVLILSLVVIAVSMYIVDYLLENSSYFMSRYTATMSGYASHRDELYSTFWNHFVNENNSFLFLFGNGANATLGISDNYAHNDWLELAINQGCIGLCAYLIFWICYLCNWTRTKKNHQAHQVLGLVFVMLFMKSFFSMSYTNFNIYISIYLGYCLAQKNNEYGIN